MGSDFFVFSVFNFPSVGVKRLQGVLWITEVTVVTQTTYEHSSLGPLSPDYRRTFYSGNNLYSFTQTIIIILLTNTFVYLYKCLVYNNLYLYKIIV